MYMQKVYLNCLYMYRNMNETGKFRDNNEEGSAGTQPPPQVTTLTVSDLGGSAVPRTMFALQELLTCHDRESGLSHVQEGGGFASPPPHLHESCMLSLHVACRGGFVTNPLIHAKGSQCYVT